MAKPMQGISPQAYVPDPQITAQARELEQKVVAFMTALQRAGMLDISATVGADLVVLSCRRLYSAGQAS